MKTEGHYLLYELHNGASLRIDTRKMGDFEYQKKVFNKIHLDLQEAIKARENAKR